MLNVEVTPFVGVWIETYQQQWCNMLSGVTPFVGVWIETRVVRDDWAERSVTPFVGVWIETILPVNSQTSGRSHPSWVCGLKPSFLMLLSQHLRSHPSWVCGLKLLLLAISALMYVTPFVGVWIETKAEHGALRWMCSHTLRGCVDWNITLII